MTSKEIFEQIIKDCKDHKIVKPLDSAIDYDTTIGEYYEEEIEELKKDLKVLDILKKCNDEIDTLYYVYVLNAHSKNKITDKECEIVKEWLEK